MIEEEAKLLEEQSRRQIYVEAGLTIEDPTAIPDLLERVVPTATPSHAIDYNTKLTIGRKIDCAACGHKRNHYKGFLVTFQNGDRALVGIECGEKEFFGPGAWERMANQLDQQKRAVLYEKRSAPAAAALERVLIHLATLSAVAHQVDELLSDFAAEFPELWEGFENATKREGKLIQTTVRAKDIVERSGLGREVRTVEEVVIAQLPCSEIIGAQTMSGRISLVSTRVRLIQKSLTGASVTMVQQAQAFNDIRQCRVQLDEVLRLYDRSLGYFAWGFWEGVAKWGRTAPKRAGNYKCKNGRFRLVADTAEEGYLKLPSTPMPSASRQAIISDWPSF